MHCHYYKNTYYYFLLVYEASVLLGIFMIMGMSLSMIGIPYIIITRPIVVIIICRPIVVIVMLLLG